ncbi:hypothetical protein NW762_008472 [Fusarium torreyae]|uniref:AB hydrolase-1 domain-containing protein n=1 Tax=Fusarium torreyae TaxID=1237075 RepID=A0A9W8VD49_9HYPO|nr:hypothetical protein NW762_008472 [Fusarium torreyae]
MKPQNIILSHLLMQFEVPLDYTNKRSPKTLKLDLIKAKATRKPFKGSVLFNPGGPGFSGVEYIVRKGSEYVEILGGHYDIIGFDPRGAGRTLRPSCISFSKWAGERRDEQFDERIATWERINSTLWQFIGDLAEDCYRAHADVGSFYGTPFVARDMISIVDALGQGDKINFWGVSYGTILGQVLASMFPKRIGRMMIDSNLLADDYLDTAGYRSVQDAKKAFLHFIDECIAAGPDLCSLASNGVTAESLLKAINKQLQLDIDPSGTGGSKGIPGGNFTFNVFVLNNLYHASRFTLLDARINGILQGNELAIRVPVKPGFPSTWSQVTEVAYRMVFCGDSSFRAETPGDLFSLYQAHLTAGPFASAMVVTDLSCARWKFQAAEQVNLNSLRNIETANPVLIINGAYDPITPASHAWEVSARLQGSRVVVHEGIGHGFRSHPSECVNDIVAKYFNEGVLPEINTTCKPDMPAFEYAKSEAEKEAKEAVGADSGFIKYMG